MKVKVEFIVETTDFGETEFKKEIVNLINEIDLETKLLSFTMKDISELETEANFDSALEGRTV